MTAQATRDSLVRQINHWQEAALRLENLDRLASSVAWQGVDQSISSVVRSSLQASVAEVIALGNTLKSQMAAGSGPDADKSLKRGLLHLRERYLKAEETVHFFTVALNSRTTPNTAALLRACDILCRKSMQELLNPLGKETPAVFTYIDKGVGASILKAGLPLWDGRKSAVAAVKITQHNLFRPTAIIHETGHQIAHILDWNRELSESLNRSLDRHSAVVSSAFASWASEIAADAYAFVHCGFAAVASLNDVVSGMPQAVFAYHTFDPHPIAYIRVLLNVEMCRQFYGPGPWDDLEEAFKSEYDIEKVDYASVGLIKLCIAALPDAASIILRRPYRAFGNRALSQVIDPGRVSPKALQKLEYLAGPSLFTSHAWIWKESLRLLALVGYQIGLGRGDLPALYKLQEAWMIKLGFSVELN